MSVHLYAEGDKAVSVSERERKEKRGGRAEI